MHEAPVFTVFLTAYYALAEVARLHRGERVLIHNAAGGVGLAAVQVAQWRGAEIYATAGNDDKRAFVRDIGVPYVMDSRSLQFAEQVRMLTAGHGVDVVLNAMAGEALRQSFALLAPYGRFVEIGKKDIAENSGLPMETFNRNVSFSAIDLDRIFRDRVAPGPAPLRGHRPGLCPGPFLCPADYGLSRRRSRKRFPVYGAKQTHWESRARPVRATCAGVPAPSTRPQIRDDATYLVTGGTRGFGLEIAKWLVSPGGAPSCPAEPQWRHRRRGAGRP